jgi:hypothetical protein
MNNGAAFFTRAVNCGCKVFMNLATGGTKIMKNLIKLCCAT